MENQHRKKERLRCSGKLSIMKSKILLLSITTVIHFCANAQQPANGPTAANTTNTSTKADLAWRMGGNSWALADPINRRNIFGFGYGNSPIYTQTDGVMRSKLNGTFIGTTQYSINGFGGLQGVNTTGYFLLGVDYGTGANSFYNSRGAFSLMHLNGNSNGSTFVQDGGYRPWMKTGITFTDNQDRAYVGYRANALDVSDFVINWSDHGVSTLLLTT